MNSRFVMSESSQYSSKKSIQTKLLARSQKYAIDLHLHRYVNILTEDPQIEVVGKASNGAVRKHGGASAISSNRVNKSTCQPADVEPTLLPRRFSSFPRFLVSSFPRFLVSSFPQPTNSQTHCFDEPGLLCNNTCILMVSLFRQPRSVLSTPSLQSSPPCCFS